MAKRSLGFRDEGRRKHKDQPAGSSLARMLPARLGVTKYRGGSAARHPGRGFGKGCQQREAGEREVKGMAKRISITRGIGCKTRVVCVRRTDGVQIGSNGGCLAVGNLLSRGSVDMVGGCEARHFRGCLAATKKERKESHRNPEGGRRERRKATWRRRRRGGYNPGRGTGKDQPSLSESKLFPQRQLGIPAYHI